MMHYQKPVILLILIVSIFESGDTNVPEGESICQRYDRITATKNVTYMDYNYYSPLRLKIVVNIKKRRTIYCGNFTRWQLVEMCCEGYEPQGKAEKATNCVPVCLSDCLHGKCVQPNLCTCEPGYRNVTNELTKHSECLPVCSNGCQGGTCTGPNTCECAMGYVLAKDKGSCTPICTIFGFGPQGCGHNALCVAPHTCQCDHGYIATTNSSTIPDLNFTSGNVWKTEDLPENDKRPTFNVSDVICRPSCEPECGVNSSCVAPNECECKMGYEESLMPKQGKNGSVCVPTCKQPCFNGFCVAPNKCVCLEGYKPHDVLNEDFCEPICHRECVNGKCTRPDNCECSDGYEKQILGAGPHETSENVCSPVCPGQCPNGTCVSPGQCRCNAGYIMNSLRVNETGTAIADTTISSISPLEHPTQQFCRPTCEPDCPMGSTCIAPNRCWFETNLGNQSGVVLATISMQIVNSTRDCGHDGVLYEENGACGCEYQVDGRKCIEPGLCAIIFTDDEQFVNLQSILLQNSDSPTSSNKFEWMFQRCPVKCRTLILSKKIVDDVGKKAEHCYLLKTVGANVGLVNAALKPWTITDGTGNETVICLSTAETMCGTVESKMDNVQAGRVVGIVVGTLIFIALIAGLAIYLARRKIRTTGVFGVTATSRSESNIMEQSESMESPLHTLQSTC